MMSMRSFSVSSRWREKLKFISSRCFTRISEVEEVSPTEVSVTPPSNSESLFGIAPRKLRNVEDEDFSPSYSQPTKTENASHISTQQNYFSQAWAAEKNRPLGRYSDRMEEQLLHPASQTSPLQSWSQSRVWLTAQNLQVSTEDSFVFVSFKVLASANAYKHRGQLYGHVPNQALDWRTRRKRLMVELETCSPDIICLQEVDRFQDLQSDLTSRGYDGIYKVRTGAAPDGCAIFWRKKRFELLHSESLEFSETGMRDNIAQFCVLKSVYSGPLEMGDVAQARNFLAGQDKCVIVGNINVLFNPKRGEMKLGQCRVFLEQAQKLSSTWPGAPLVIGGCFNCTPESSMYEYLAKGALDLSGLDRRYISGQIAAAANTGPKMANDAKKLGTLSLKETLANLETEETEKSLGERLRTSLMHKFSSEHDRNAKEFADSAKGVLKLQPDSKESNVNDKLDCKLEISGPSLFVSKTIEILEDSLSRTTKEKKSEEKGMTEMVVPSCNNGTEKSVLSEKLYEHNQAANGESITSASVDEQLGTQIITNVHVAEKRVEFENNTECSSLSVENLEKESNVIRAADNASSGSEEPLIPGHGWSFEDLKLATGSPDSTVIKHNLKLFSVYPEIQGGPDTRDSKGEPLVTMYHRQFRGTVDYIWRSDGLQTTKVLDVVPLKAMLVTPGLPSLVHGSDHIALACELSFNGSSHN